MNSAPSFLLLTLAVFSLPPLSAAPPVPLSAADKEALLRDASPAPAAVAEAVAAARSSLAQDLADSAAASQAAANFLAQNALPAGQPQAAPAPAQPFNLKLGAETTEIDCEDGIYFDPDEGVLVCMKNVKVTDPRFKLTAKDQLKVFFGKPPAKAKKQDSTTSDPESVKSGFGKEMAGNFGDPERVIATGAVLFEQVNTAPGKQPIQASGAIFSYNLKQDQITISGGLPWIVQPPGTYLRAMEPNLSVQIFPKAGSFRADGRWQMGGSVPTKK